MDEVEKGHVRFGEFSHLDVGKTFQVMVSAVDSSGATGSLRFAVAIENPLMIRIDDELNGLSATVKWKRHRMDRSEYALFWYDENNNLIGEDTFCYDRRNGVYCVAEHKLYTAEDTFIYRAGGV